MAKADTSIDFSTIRLNQKKQWQATVQPFISKAQTAVDQGLLEDCIDALYDALDVVDPEEDEE